MKEFRAVLRTACGCERIILAPEEGFSGKPPRTLILPLMRRTHPAWLPGQDAPSELKRPTIKNRAFELTDLGWVGPGEECFVYEEIV